MHTCGSLRSSVTGVVELWILTSPLSPPPVLALPAVGSAPALDAPNARVNPVAATAAATVTARLLRFENVNTRQQTPLAVQLDHGRRNSDHVKKSAGTLVAVTPVLRSHDSDG